MSAFNKARVPSCCGSFATVYELNFPLKREQVEQFKDAGFVISKAFFAAGMLYAENDKLVAIGTFGKNKIDLKCKVPKCDTVSTDLDAVLTRIHALRQKRPT